MVYAPQKIEKYKNIFTQFLETYIFNREYHRILKPQPTEIYLRLEDNYLRSRTSPFGARVIHLGNSPAIFLIHRGPICLVGAMFVVSFFPQGIKGPGLVVKIVYPKFY